MAWSKEAQTLIEEVADDAVGSFKDDLDDLVSKYCMDIDLARPSVEGFLQDLPKNKAPHTDGFIAWKILHQSADVLAKYAKEARLLLEHKDPITHESIKPDDKTPTVDDTAIRESAGFDKDKDVAESSLTDKAQEHRITDNDIGQSSRDESFVYEDQVLNVPDPATVYRRATRYLFSTIIDQCLGNPPPQRLDALIQNNVVTRDQILRIVKDMRRQLDSGLKIPKIDDQMS